MLIDSFLDYLKFERNYSDKTILFYRIDLCQFKDFVSEKNDFDPNALKAELIREWIVFMMDKGYTTTSVNRKLSSLRSFFKYLLREEVMAIDPMRKIVGPKNRKSLPVFVKEADMDRLLDDINFGTGFRACRDRLIIEMFYVTGIRVSELVGLNDESVDLGLMTLKVTGKRNKQRLVPFSESFKSTLLEYVNMRDKEIQSKTDAFFVNEDGERLYSGLIYKIVKRNLSKVVTLKKRSPHVLRHSFATAMLNNEAELGAIKELLGHASLAATEKYTHATFEELKKVYKQAHPRA